MLLNFARWPCRRTDKGLTWLCMWVPHVPLQQDLQSCAPLHACTRDFNGQNKTFVTQFQTIMRAFIGTNTPALGICVQSNQAPLHFRWKNEKNFSCDLVVPLHGSWKRKWKWSPECKNFKTLLSPSPCRQEIVMFWKQACPLRLLSIATWEERCP